MKLLVMKSFKMLCLLLLAKPVLSQPIDTTLQQLVEKACMKSYDEQIYKQKTEEIRLDRRNAKSTFLPKVSGSMAYMRLNDDLRLSADLENLLLGSEKLLIKEHLGIPFNVSLPANVPVKPIDPIQQKNLFTISGNAEWVLFSGGKVHYALQALDHKQKVIEYLSEQQRTKIAMETTELYDKQALLIASERALKTTADYLAEQKRFVLGAISNGLATPLERQKIELAEQRLETRKLEVSNNKELVMEKLHQLTGIDIAILRECIPQLTIMVNDVSGTNYKRSEIKMLDEAIAASDKKYKMEMTDYIPKVAAMGHYEFRKKDITMPTAVPTWLVGVGLQWNIFDGFVARNNAKKAHAEKTEYELRKAETEELIALANKKATLEFATAMQKIKMMQQQVTLSEKNLELGNKQFRNGLTNITEYLNSVNDLEKSNLDLQNTFYEQRRAAFALLEAKGLIVSYFKLQSAD